MHNIQISKILIIETNFVHMENKRRYQNSKSVLVPENHMLLPIFFQKTFQKIMKKIGDEHTQVFYIHAKFIYEMIFFLLCAQNQCSEKIFFNSILATELSFLHGAAQITSHHGI